MPTLILTFGHLLYFKYPDEPPRIPPTEPDAIEEELLQSLSDLYKGGTIFIKEGEARHGSSIGGAAPAPAPAPAPVPAPTPAPAPAPAPAPPRAPSPPVPIMRTPRQPLRVKFQSTTPSDPELRELLRQPRNADFIRQRGNIRGFFNIGVPRLDASAAAFTCSRLVFHGTSFRNYDAILRGGFKPSAARHSVYGGSVCVTPDLTEASQYQSAISMGHAVSPRNIHGIVNTRTAKSSANNSETVLAVFMVAEFFFNEDSEEIGWIQNGSHGQKIDPVAVFGSLIKHLHPRYLIFIDAGGPEARSPEAHMRK